MKGKNVVFVPHFVKVDAYTSVLFARIPPSNKTNAFPRDKYKTNRRVFASPQRAFEFRGFETVPRRTRRPGRNAIAASKRMRRHGVRVISCATRTRVSHTYVHLLISTTRSRVRVSGKPEHDPTAAPCTV